MATAILPALNKPDLEELPEDQVIKVAIPDGETVKELEPQTVSTDARREQ